VEEQEKVTSQEEAEVEAHKKKAKSAVEEPQTEEGTEEDFELHKRKSH
jgi:hypothetical protein